MAEDVKLVNTEVFSLEIPKSWIINEEKEKKYLFAHTNESHDGWPVEMIMIDYCKMGGPPKEVNSIQCGICSEKIFIEFLKQPKNHHGPFDIEKSIKNGVVEYRSGKFGNDGAKVSVLKCNKNGQIYMMLMASKKPTNEFANILSSLKLK